MGFGVFYNKATHLVIFVGRIFRMRRIRLYDRIILLRKGGGAV
jgi:hypothetical protein